MLITRQVRKDGTISVRRKVFRVPEPVKPGEIVCCSEHILGARQIALYADTFGREYIGHAVRNESPITRPQ